VVLTYPKIGNYGSTPLDSVSNRPANDIATTPVSMIEDFKGSAHRRDVPSPPLLKVDLAERLAQGA
jgi:hypothetical protein